ncbi:MAG: hypothetical protein OHK0029_40330 [Armatimonadaceae bacterium]
MIEYLIAGQDSTLKHEIVRALKGESNGIPAFKTVNTLGDYVRTFDNFLTATDVKTKIVVLNSNPKAYNIDKMLEFLSEDRSVFMFYFVGMSYDKIEKTILTSIFQQDILQATITLKHWSGRNSRGVTQLDGKEINRLIYKPDSTISEDKSKKFLETLIAL